jgi:hypothetical protein
MRYDLWCQVYLRGEAEHQRITDRIDPGSGSFIFWLLRFLADPFANVERLERPKWSRA